MISNVFAKCIEGNCIDGIGTKVRDGITFKGQFKNNKLNGQGKVILSNGLKFEGQFKNDFLNGQGKMTSPKGYVYEGEWKNQKRDGQGKVTFDTGQFYEGEWKNNKYHGQGKYDYADGSYYIGSWENGNKHGKGKMIYANGEIIEGKWENDERIEFAKIDPKKYWEGALNCYRYTDNPNKKSQRGYIDQLTLRVENYKRSKNMYDENDIIMYSKMIVKNLGCSKDLFK